MNREPSVRVNSGRRYLIVIKSLGFLYSHFWELALTVQSAGWDLHIIASENADPQPICNAGMKFYPVALAHSPWDLKSDVYRTIETYRLIQKIRPDCIHLIYLKNVLFDGISARLHGRPVIGAVTGLGSLFSDNKLIYRALRPGVLFCMRQSLRHHNSILAIENTDDEELLLRCGVVAVGRTRVIPGAGIRRDMIQPRSSRPDRIVIFCAARMIRPKGVGELLAAAKMLREKGLNFELWLAGGIDNKHPEAITQSELRTAELAGSVQWLGYRSDITNLLHQASIVCLPTYYREGLPRSLVEAAAAGLPIVTTDVAGCRDVVVDGLNGFLVPPRSTEHLAEALEKLICSPDLRSAMGRASRIRFEQKFSLDSVFEAFNECYLALGLDLRLRVAEISSAGAHDPV